MRDVFHKKFKCMSAKRNAVACDFRHVCAHLYQDKPALADTERTRHAGRTREQTHTHDARNTTQEGGGHTNGVKKTHPDSQSELKRVRAHHLGLPNDTTLETETIIKGICCCSSCCRATHNAVNDHQTYWKSHGNLGNISSNYHWIALPAA